jgi:hypothetical protein
MLNGVVVVSQMLRFIADPISSEVLAGGGTGAKRILPPVKNMDSHKMKNEMINFP